MIPIEALKGNSVGVLGLGRSGMAAARALRQSGAQVHCWDDGEASRARAAAEGFRLTDLSAPKHLMLSYYVVSPGIPHLYPSPHPAVAYALKEGIPVDNDIGVFLAENADRGGRRARVIAITGTNGKSTTAALTHHLLRAAGLRAHLAGNIGRAVFEPPADDPDKPLGPHDVVVLELSSYQLDLARSLACDVGVFTNFNADHLDRHGGLGGYFAAKARLFDHAAHQVVGVGSAEGLMICNRRAPDAFSERRAPRALIRVEPSWPPQGVRAPVSINAGGLQRLRGAAVGVEPGRIQIARDARRRDENGRQWTTAQYDDIDLSGAPALQGLHNAENAAAALSACLLLDLPIEQVAPGLQSFPGLPHRMQTIAKADGVLYVNDSKATNADAAEKALRTFERIRWIVGGLAKDGGVDTLAPLFPRVAKAYLIGASQEAFAPILAAAGVVHERCGNIDTAVARAQAEAEAGETVLLAPACASFDQFPDFEKRGDAFVAAVKRALGRIDDA